MNADRKYVSALWVGLVASVLFFAAPTRAQFTIGVWQPGGHVAADASFGTAEVNDLTALGIDLLVDSTPRVDNAGSADHSQDFEESIMSQWGGHGGFVVFFEPEDTDPYGRTLEYYAGRTATIIQSELNAKVSALVNKWGNPPYADAFYGYRIGHENAPDGQGIYDSNTYSNLATVIQTIRNYDTTRRIIAIGNVDNLGSWSLAEQTAFRQQFFRPATEPGPANILRNPFAA